MLIEISASSQVSNATQKLCDKVRSLADRRHDVAWIPPGGIEPGMKPMCSALENTTFTLASTKTGLGKTLK